MSSLEKCLFRSSAHFLIGSFVFLLLSCMSSLFNLENRPCLSHHLQIFPPSLRLSFCFVYGFLCCVKAYKFDYNPFVYFCFSFYCLGKPNKTLLWFMSENALLMFSSRIFMVSCFIFKSLSHFEFIFLYGVSVCSNFIDLHAAVQLSQHHLQKSLSFSHCILLPRLLKFNWL